MKRRNGVVRAMIRRSQNAGGHKDRRKDILNDLYDAEIEDFLEGGDDGYEAGYNKIVIQGYGKDQG